jgi:cytoskeletal protein RodZ
MDSFYHKKALIIGITLLLLGGLIFWFLMKATPHSTPFMKKPDPKIQPAAKLTPTSQSNKPETTQQKPQSPPQPKPLPPAESLDLTPRLPLLPSNANTKNTVKMQDAPNPSRAPSYTPLKETHSEKGQTLPTGRYLGETADGKKRLQLGIKKGETEISAQIQTNDAKPEAVTGVQIKVPIPP